MSRDILVGIFTAILLCLFCALGETRKVLMVDEDGNVNAPETLATTAQLAANETAIMIADAKASGAAEAAKEGTNLVADVVSQIMANELVVYRKGFTDSFSSAILLSEDDRLVITKFEPHKATNGELVAHDITYAITADVGSIKPLIKTRLSLTDGDFTALPNSQVGDVEPVAGTYTDEDGTEYSNIYKVRFWCNDSERTFFTVYLNGGTPEGDGSVLNITGGIQGGKSAVVDWGGNRLTFKGGLLVGVEAIE